MDARAKHTARTSADPSQSRATLISGSLPVMLHNVTDITVAIIKPIVLVGLVASIEPMTGIDVVTMVAASAGLGALGGIAQALRSHRTSKLDIVNAAINMGCFGTSISLIGVWYFEPDESLRWMLIGFSGMSGLVGLPIFEPLSKHVGSALDRALSHIFGNRKNDDES